jgi:hypothetical protein
MENRTSANENSSKNESGITRRDALITGGAGAAAAVGTYLVHKDFESSESSEESNEGLGFSEEISGYMAYSQLRSHEIIFVDESNVPLGGPVDFSNAIPNELKPHGVAISPPPLRWRKEVAGKLEADPANEGRKVARSYNPSLVFKAALNYKDEPELVNKIKSGEVATFIDIVRYFGQKPVRGVDKETSRAEYVSAEFKLSERVPAIVRDEIQTELSAVVPGLCAQESKFYNNLTSSAGAKGIFQFMPNIWQGYGKKESDINSLKAQTEVAGLLMSNIYGELMQHCDEHALLKVRDAFSSQSDFLKHFIVPLMINSYNSGSSRLAAAVNQFFVPERDISGLVGKELFLAMVDFAQETETGILSRYRSDAREYVSRAYALSRVL